ncbi:MAG TPA: acetate/propionate family kinase [Miltoncostaea sp.]|nr:acetate/propionate family kinase [Miltoncostaea sp.]
MRSGSILTVNAGSTSLKLRLVDPAGASEGVPTLDDLPAGVVAVGHRIVHGGPRLTAPALLDGDTAAQLEEAAALAPLHDRPAIDAIAAARRALPDVPHVLVPDTGFHATVPAEASTYAIPARWREAWGIRRYGFHGISVAWAAERAAAMLGRGDLRLVVCHLGGGASVTAVRDGRSVDTTMGFGPLEGLVMATRSGTVDPDVPLHLVLRHGMDPAEVERALNEDSGLRALAGTGDMREVEAAAARGDGRASLALAVHDHRLAAAVAAMTAALGGLDALAFTGGVGEGSARTRAEAARRLGFLGVAVDPDAGDGAGDRDVSPPGARVRTLVIHSREDLVIARGVRAVLGGDDPEGGPA